MRTLTGSCHCGGVQIEIDLDSGPEGLKRCDCSLCRRKGAVMAYVKKTKLRVTRGQELLSCYKWNTQVAEHFFCKRCGIYTHHGRRVAPDEYGYNVGCFDDLDLDDLGEIPMTDGKSLSLVGN
ncbi:MAG: GFA family protein [Gammaproteobacteria bacterium]